MTNKKIVEGEVTTNKKRFGLFPYVETLATFEAELLAPGQKLPNVVLPDFSNLRFMVRNDIICLDSSSDSILLPKISSFSRQLFNESEIFNCCHFSPFPSASRRFRQSLRYEEIPPVF